MSTTIDTRFFRAGVGTVIYNSNNEVAFFERAQNPVGVWQFQQGGIDLGEQPTDTLWRELAEEIGLGKDDFSLVTEYPHWTVYQYDYTISAPDKSRLGQAHRWYFLKLADGVEIDLTKATEFEASNHTWLSFDEVIARTDNFKKHVYQALAEHFATVIVKNT